MNDSTMWMNGIGIYLNRSCHFNQVYNNTLCNNRIGISLEGNSPQVAGDMTNNLVINNIVVNSITRALIGKFGGENDGTHGSGNVYTHNCFGPEHLIL